MPDRPRTGVALIGLGMVSSTYALALRDLQDHIELRGVYARNPDARAAFLSANSDLCSQDYTSVQEIADDPTVDFVILTTPPNARREIVATLAQAGKDILMEKPLERTLEAARDICGICSDLDVKLGIMLQHRARPVVADLRKLIDGGELGPLCSVEVNVPWWRPQSYYDEPGRGTYDRDGGGVLLSQAIHTLDLMLSLTGSVESVTAQTATTALHQMESEDFVSAGVQFSSGAVGHIFVTTASYPGRPESIVLNFANASMVLGANQLNVYWHDGREQEIGKASTSGAGANPMAFTSDWHRDVIANFDRSLRDNSAPMVPGTEALGVHALIAAIETSGRLGKRVTLSELDEL